MRAPKNIELLVVAGLLCGLTAPALSQDDPFSIPAEETVENPFAEPAEAEAPSPFADPGEVDPFAVEPGVSEDPFTAAGQERSPFTQNVPPEPEPIDPFSSTAPPSVPADPFENATSPGAAPSDQPRISEMEPAEPTADVDDPFGFEGAPEGTSPFGAMFGEEGEEGVDSGIFAFEDEGATGSQGGIATLYEFRYIEVPRMFGESIVIRKRMPLEEAREWDKQKIAEFSEAAAAGEYPLFNASQQSADDWAEWMLYADQLELWDRYVREVVLIGTASSQQDAEEPSAIDWPGDPLIPQPQQQQGQQQTLAGEPGLVEGERNIYNENRSLDEQLHDFNPVADTRQGSQGQTVYSPEEMNDQAKALYQQYLTELRNYEMQQVAFMQQLENDLLARKQKREAYSEWRNEQMVRVVQFVNEWERRYQGKVTTIAGVRYELYRPDNVPQLAPRGANIVVTDYDLTPYDILNEDGTLRGPSNQ